MAFIDLMNPDIEIQYENKTYKFGGLTFKDLAEYVLWYQYKELEEAEIVTKSLPKEMREAILRETYEKCKNKRWVIKDEHTNEIVTEKFLSWETPEVQQSSMELSGIIQQCYLSLRTNHPEITRELANRICKPADMNVVLEKILIASGLAQEKILTAGETLPGEAKPNQ